MESSQPLVDDPRAASPYELLQRHCAADLEGVDAVIGGVLETQTQLLNEVGEYIAHSRGKKLRPILTLLCGRGLGARGDGLLKVAAAMELVHNATLLHDDVIDKSELRRGKPTINARFGNEVAILTADYLYSSAFELALEPLKPEILQRVCGVTRKMCEGELFQIEKGQARLGRDDYYRVIRAKTGNLFAACCALGGVVAGASRAKCEALARYGLAFGLAFQITDDILDYVADEEVFGKSIGTDIYAGKQTLPLILAIEALDATAGAELFAAYRASDVPRVIALVEAAGGIEAARETARGHVAEANEALGELGRKGPWEMLRDLAQHLVERTY